jgi:hypothetical protein
LGLVRNNYFFVGREIFSFISMRKFIVSSLAVVALGMGGFAVHSVFNTNIAWAQPFIDPPIGGGNCSWAYNSRMYCDCTRYDPVIRCCANCNPFP